MAMQTSNGLLPFRNNDLYLIISAFDRPDQWYWSLFVCISYPWGHVYNAVSKSSYWGPVYWEFEELVLDTLVQSSDVLVAIKLASLPDEESLVAVFLAVCAIYVPREGGFVEKWGEDFGCKVWVKEALEKLISDGLVEFEGGVNELEERAVAIVRMACSEGVRVLVDLRDI
ncbi:hypothetical protein PHISCL_10153 [Aspergillus sclerotialis]|uniref:Uncharacterized protein n=1 Tax=Aspergillus sclerotialis TaxID=2070753 RepID=A0A3A2Z363_9EURO|nr:hypothetical protein PHISCL_10153 [Aspergillus sclerotialis]